MVVATRSACRQRLLCNEICDDASLLFIGNGLRDVYIEGSGIPHLGMVHHVYSVGFLLGITFADVRILQYREELCSGR